MKRLLALLFLFLSVQIYADNTDKALRALRAGDHADLCLEHFIKERTYFSFKAWQAAEKYAAVAAGHDRNLSTSDKDALAQMSYDEYLTQAECQLRSDCLHLALPHSMMVDCPECEGGVCPVCKGRAKLMMDNIGTAIATGTDIDKQFQCFHCGNTGNCPRCTGSGVISVFDKDPNWKIYAQRAAMISQLACVRKDGGFNLSLPNAPYLTNVTETGEFVIVMPDGSFIYSPADDCVVDENTNVMPEPDTFTEEPQSSAEPENEEPVSEESSVNQDSDIKFSDESSDEASDIKFTEETPPSEVEDNSLLWIILLLVALILVIIYLVKEKGCSQILKKSVSVLKYVIIIIVSIFIIYLLIIFGRGLYANYKVSSTKIAGEACGHEYVDMGLPSRTLWATCNVGAKVCSDYGDYYRWGEITANENSSYKYMNDSKYSPDKYSSTYDGKGELELMDDAAYNNWGEEWIIPTDQQLTELFNPEFTMTINTYCNHVYGVAVISKVNGSALFFPYAGEYNYESQGDFLRLWSRNADECSGCSHAYFSYDEWFLFAWDYYMLENLCKRESGLSLRPILGVTGSKQL